MRSEKERKEAMRFICMMLSSFFEVTEEQGLGDLKMHKQIEDGDFIRELVFELKGLPIKKFKDPYFLALDLNANTTMWELKKLIALHSNSSPLNIQLKRDDSKKAAT
jgi:hypothetical protein